MYGRLKKELKHCFSAPEPERKKEFLARLGRPENSFRKFIFAQIPYIRKYIWIVSAVIFPAAVWGACRIDLNVVRVISAMAPFLALMAVTETAKSAYYGMEELEQSTLYDRRSIFLSRLFILGVFNLAILCAFLPFGCWRSGYTLPQTVLAVFVPYLLTDFLCLVITHRMRGKQGAYLCLAVSFVIALLDFSVHAFANRLLERAYEGIWLLALLALVFLTASEIAAILKEMGKQQWNFQLTD